MTTNTRYVEADIQRTAVFGYDGASDAFKAIPAGAAHDAELRFEWTDAGGGVYKPLYIGTATTGTAASAATWVIQRFTWTDVGGGTIKPTRIQTLIGAWDNRASLGW